MGRFRMIKAIVVLITLGYCSLLVYQGSVNFNLLQETRPGSVQAAFTFTTSEPVTDSKVQDSVPNKNITLDDIFISVKTSKHYHDTRLPHILNSWYLLAKEQTWLFTDEDNDTLKRLTNGHLVNTNCSDTHQRAHLCCKTSVEYDWFLQSGKKWWCHFDDDNYVNVPRLVAKLQEFDPQEDWYLGRTSIDKPVMLYSKTPVQVKKTTRNIPKTLGPLWFGTFGAGICISKSLALKMVPIASGGKFISICNSIKLPDDVTMGYVISHLMKTKMVEVKEFHSHLEQMKLLPPNTLRDQISFGYSSNNVLNVPGFDEKYDPTRFLSLHCFLFPHFEFCPR